MTLPKVCISILNWNSYANTLKCLQSLGKLDYPRYDVIVVDNASTDGSISYIRDAMPETRIIQAESNLGYAEGNRLALDAALADSDTELFWILNNDATVTPNTLHMLVDAYAKNGEALYGGVPIAVDSTPWRVKQYVMTRFIKGTNFIYTTNLTNRLYDECFPSKEPRTVNNLHGSTLLIPLNVARKFGYMDSAFFLYGEENDYCLRMKKNGIRSILVPESVIFHIGAGSRAQRQALDHMLQYYQTRNLLTIFKRHSGIVYYAAQVGYVFFKAIRKMLSGAENTAFARYMLYGIRDSIAGRMGKTFKPEDFVGVD